MTVYQGEKFSEFLKKNNISVQEAADLLGISRQGVYKYFKSGNLDIATVNNIVNKFKVKENSIWNDNPRLEAIPKHLASDPNDFNNDGSKFEELGDGTLRMRVPIVPARAYAGYLRGFADPEYYEDLDTISIDVQKRHGGDYMAFEVKGDSMISTDPKIMEQNVYEGWIAVGRDLSKHQWQYKLHTHNYDTWIIVHKRKGILIKQIANHDVEKAEITIHSLNPEYDDETFSLNDIDQIFSVVQIINRRK